MTEREQIDEILERIQRNMIGYIDWISPVGRGLLAAPLEAANARIKELEAEIAPLRQFVGHSLVLSDYRTSDEMRTQITELREAVRVLAKECHTWRKRHDVEDVNRMGYSDIDAVNANPTARAAIAKAGGVK